MQSFHVKASQNPHRLKIARIPAFWNYHASLWLSSKVSWDSWEFCPSAVLVHFVHYSRILGNLEPVRELCLLFSKAFRSFCWISSGFVPFKYSLESKLVMQNSGGIFLHQHQHLFYIVVLIAVARIPKNWKSKIRTDGKLVPNSF